MGYWHIATEIFYDQEACCAYQTCTDGEGEDPNCSDKFNNVLVWSISDHLDYFGYYTGCSNTAFENDGESPTI